MILVWSDKIYEWLVCLDCLQTSFRTIFQNIFIIQVTILEKLQSLNVWKSSVILDSMVKYFLEFPEIFSLYPDAQLVPELHFFY